MAAQAEVLHATLAKSLHECSANKWKTELRQYQNFVLM
jgi:hypothetical protein